MGRKSKWLKDRLRHPFHRSHKAQAHVTRQTPPIALKPPQPPPRSPSRAVEAAPTVTTGRADASAGRSHEPDLWDQAYSKLQAAGKTSKLVRQYEEALLGSGLSNDADKERLLSAFVKVKGNEIDKQRWIVHVGGMDIKVRNVANKVIDGVIWAKDVIGEAVKSSGEPHAALAWAGVCLILPLLLNPFVQDHAAMDGLGKITDLIYVYRVRQKTHCRTSAGKNDDVATKDLRKQFKKKTVDLYAQILEFQIRVACRYSRLAILNYGRDLFKDDPFDPIIDDIRKLDDVIQGITKELDSEFFNNAFQEQDLLLKQIEARLESQDERAESELRHRCLSAFNTSLDYENCKNHVRTRLPGTCKWFLEHEDFLEWMRLSKPAMLYMTADPGCGKSVLLRSLVEDDIASGTRKITCYFFFNETYPQERSVLEAISALLHQIFRQAPHLIECALGPFREHQYLSKNFTQLWKILLACAKTFDGQIICVLDALDECKATDTPTGKREYEEQSGILRGDLVRSLTEWQQASHADDGTEGKGVLKFLISARQGVADLQKFNSSDTELRRYYICADGKISDADLKTFVNAKVMSLNLKENVKKSLIEKLLKVQGESRTFLWLRVVLELLEEQPEFQQTGTLTLEKFLKGDLPQSLYEAYEKVLERSSDSARGKLILHILLVAVIPLTVQEVNFALKFAKMGEISKDQDLELQDEKLFETTLRSYCGLFVAVQRDRTVRLIHSTARTFLEPKDGNSGRSGPLWQHSFDPKESHAVLARACMSYLRYNALQEDTDFAHQSPRIEDWRTVSPASRNAENARQDDISRRRLGALKIVHEYLESHIFMAYASIQWLYHLGNIGQSIPPDISNQAQSLMDMSSPLFKPWFLCGWGSLLGTDPNGSQGAPTTDNFVPLQQSVWLFVGGTLSDDAWYAPPEIQKFIGSEDAELEKKRVSATFVWRASAGLDGLKTILDICS